MIDSYLPIISIPGQLPSQEAQLTDKTGHRTLPVSKVSDRECVSNKDLTANVTNHIPPVSDSFNEDISTVEDPDTSKEDQNRWNYIQSDLPDVQQAQEHLSKSTIHCPSTQDKTIIQCSLVSFIQWNCGTSQLPSNHHKGQSFKLSNLLKQVLQDGLLLMHQTWSERTSSLATSPSTVDQYQFA